MPQSWLSKPHAAGVLEVVHTCFKCQIIVLALVSELLIHVRRITVACLSLKMLT